MKPALWLGSLAVLALIPTPIAQGGDPPAASNAITDCSTRAYVIDTDPAGLNVRLAPGGEIIDKLPAGAMVEITGQKGGWLRIANAEYPCEGADLERFAKANGHAGCAEAWVKLPKLKGWVFAKKLGTSTRKYGPEPQVWLLTRADTTSEKVFEVVKQEARVTLVGCKGEWLEVEFQGRTGWLEPSLSCPNSLTTCP
jgi:hypothetical protein